MGNMKRRVNVPVIGNDTLNAVAWYCPRLRSLRLQDVEGSLVSPNLAVDQGLREIAKRLSHLEVLRLHLPLAAAGDVAEVVKSSKHLTDVYSHVSSQTCSQRV